MNKKPRKRIKREQTKDKRKEAKVYTPEKIKEIHSALNKYIDETDIPIVCEFAYKNNIRRTALYEIPELADTLKKLIEKKEAQLELKGLKGEINTTMAIFSLKQIGWKDKQEVDMTHNFTPEILDKMFKAWLPK